MRFEREISLLPTFPGCGRTSPIGAKPSRVDSLPNRKSAVAYFDRFTERRKLSLPPILIGALCVIIGTAGTSPAMKNWPPRVLLLYDLPDFRMVRLNSRNNPPPYWMSRVRRGTPHYGRKRLIRGRWKNIIGDSFWGFLVLCRILDMSDNHHSRGDAKFRQRIGRKTCGTARNAAVGP